MSIITSNCIEHLLKRYIGASNFSIRKELMKALNIALRK